ncbi:acyl carrier protein [Marinoscillum sp. MHG1-6]|uniref:acyl carrier protein n=1 Tax=Marinoscillum sp. MHG1-6 TaxID=2959627 RepID=UPI0021580DAF|nr:acyl carrier protein [Marinoscillum sp. MHG1-6]
MTREQIKDELKGIIGDYVPEKELLESLSEEHELIGDLKINSAHIVDIVLDIEDKYDIMIEDEAIGKMGTVGESIDIIFQKLDSK